MDKSNKTVSCDFYDQVEIHAMRQNLIDLSFKEDETIQELKSIRIKTLETREKVEYLITQAGVKIPLNIIVSMKKTIKTSS